ncbi:MAG: sialidase family protein [Limisphaerales bacterium]
MRTLLVAVALLSVTIGASHAQVPVVPKTFAGAKQPQVAVALDNSVFVAFGKGDSIYVARSTNNAKNFEPPQLVGTVPKLSLGMRRGPRVIAADNVIAVSAISHQEGNLYCWVSRDGGAHWSKASRVNDEPKAAREGLHAMAAHGNTVATAWLDLRTGKTELYGAISKDGGVTWSTNFLIYRSPDGHICECCHPSLAFGPDGKLYAMWRNWLNGSRDMYLAASADDGKTFSSSQKLGSGTWPLNACPMDGGAIAIRQDGSPYAVWRRGKAVFSSTTNSETVLEPEGSQPCVVATDSSIFTAWQHGGEIVIRKTHTKGPIAFSVTGKYPAMAASGSDVVVVWETGDDNTPIMAKKL